MSDTAIYSINNNTSEKNGFTLLEISVVLVAISLILVAIIAGANMIQSAKIRSVISDVNGFHSAIAAFGQKYHALPGDIRNAHAYFDDGADGVCGTNALAPTGCNGNNNGKIDTVGEEYRLLQHLVLAGILKGSYTGIDAGTPDVQIGVNAPSSRIETGGFWIRYFSTLYGRSGNFIEFGSEGGASNGMQGAIINSADAYSIDLKLDDGIADNGDVYAVYGFNGADVTGCVTAKWDTSAASYIKTNELKTCRMIFWLK